MAVVKGSAHQRLKVVAYNPATDFIRNTVLILLLAFSLIGAYLAGSWYVSGQLNEALAENVQLEQDLSEKSTAVVTLNQRVSVLEEGSKLDKQANDAVRESVKEFRDRIAELEKEVAFYKNIMAPAGSNTGLHIEKLELSTSSEERQFKFKVVLTQLEKNQNYISGHAAINFVGELNGEKKIYSLRELSEEVKDLGVKFRFRYFQNITGNIQLPAEFSPEAVQVILQTKGKKAVRVEKVFDWIMGESVNNVGQ
jgi:outer membrane murein-binding lipoprotein Lpp